MKSNECFFVTDLHGRTDRYEKLFKKIVSDKPAAVFFGGDLLPSILKRISLENNSFDFIKDYFVPELKGLKKKLKKDYPRIFLILGNDDGKLDEETVKKIEKDGIWEYVHGRRVKFGDYWVYGYSYVPPSPFLLKDWERYDVSRYVDPGCISPEEGKRTVPVPEKEIKNSTIEKDLDALVSEEDLTKSVFLFHAPPDNTNLDRAGIDGRMIDHVPLDVHVGSVAVRRFIEKYQPLVTMHGHIHESARITGIWHEMIGITHCLSAAYDGPELALVRFELKNMLKTRREII